MSHPALLVGIHQPGTSLLHRTPAGPKVAALGIFSLAVVLVRSMPASWAWLGVAVLAAAVARLDAPPLARASRPLVVVLVVVAAFQWWLYGRDRAIESAVDLVALSLAALVVSATTPVNLMLDLVVRVLGPLRPLGVDPDRVALVFGLAIQALPGSVALALETRDAARARGLERRPRAYLAPFVVRVVARAHETGDALKARGLGDD